MDKLLYFGIPEHGTTGSTRFLVELLEREFEVRDYTGRLPDRDLLESGDVFLFFQRPPSIEAASLIGDRRLIFVPMYDEARNYSRQTIRSWGKYRILNFCRVMHEDLSSWGFHSYYAQYFPTPAIEKPASVDAGSAFWWHRESCYINESIDDRTVLRLIGKNKMSLHIHSAVDSSAIPSDLVSRRTTWFESRSSMLEAVRNCELYFAPRESEGIGMSFLEAMANGLAVVGADNPTINEYIKHDATGYLFDPLQPRELRLSSIQRIRSASLDSIGAGHERWEQEKWGIIDMIRGSLTLGRKQSVPRGFKYRSIKEKKIMFRIKRLVKRLVGK